MKKFYETVKTVLEKALKILAPIIALYRILKEVLDRWVKS